MEKVSTITSRSLVMSSTNIDTDQIIPARFLTTTTREGLGKALFADWRYDAEGQPRPDFLLNTPEAVGRTVLVAGRNFGCGSSREHAPWALVDFGFRAVISTEIADIFRSNALKNGLVPVIVDEDTHAWLIAHPGAEVTVDVERCVLSLPGNREVSFPLESFARYCLLNGVDELGFLLSRMPAIEEYERRGAK
ncbi:MAG: 3-isopropylmalate dehydratase small subunit [Steroidobacteraceae bacterium]|jgi:3-isopropylmalate/(R)-2-methylmalate dehydratase small subunit